MRSLFILFNLLIAFGFFSCGKKTMEGKPERKDITETVFASGTLEPDKKYNLTAQSDGYILEIRFDDGDTVKTNEVLAIIDNKNNSISAQSAEALLGLAAQNASKEGPTLKQAELNLKFLKDKYEQDSLQNTRYQKLFQSNSVSKLELETVKLTFESSKTSYFNSLQNYRLASQQTQQQLVLQRSQSEVNNVASENNEVKAVVGGKVYKRMKEVGDFVRKGDVIAIIGSPDVLYTKLSIDETNISKIKLGQSVVVQLNTIKDKNFNGTVSEIYPSFDDQSQSFYIKVLFTEKPDFRIAGTQLQANIVVAEKKNAMLIPKNFLGFGNKVNVKGKGEVAVETGFISNDKVEILKGLEDNETIITDKLQ